MDESHVNDLMLANCVLNDTQRNCKHIFDKVYSFDVDIGLYCDIQENLDAALYKCRICNYVCKTENRKDKHKNKRKDWLKIYNRKEKFVGKIMLDPPLYIIYNKTLGYFFIRHHPEVNNHNIT